MYRDGTSNNGNETLTYPQPLRYLGETRKSYIGPESNGGYLWIVDKEHIIVGNDNNYPFSSSREPNVADDNEFILLSVPDLLKP